MSRLAVSMVISAVLLVAACAESTQESIDSSVETAVAETVSAQGTPTQLPGSEYNMVLSFTSQSRTVTFYATIMGGSDSSRELYCKSENWQFGDGRSRGVSPLCAFTDGDQRVRRNFETTHPYEEPGIYEATFSYSGLVSNIVVVNIE